MAKMKAMEFTDKLNLQPVIRPVPEPQAGEILIQVSAVGVTRTEKLWSTTSHYADGTARSKAIPGHEFSGTVAGLGAGVTGYSLGDAVFGLNDWFAEGATAEFCITKPSNLSLKPSSLSHIEAASVPIGLLTAWQGLHVQAKLQKGERVLIHGGAGAVGLAAEVESSTDPREKSAYFIVEQDGEQLASLGKLFDSGELKAFVKAELPMEEADHAYSGSIAGNPGKLIIRTK